MAGRGFKIADAWVEITTDLDEVRKGVRGLPGKIGPDADRAGRDVGGKLSQGIHLSIIRNSPLIAAAVGAALAVGAPALMAAATGLFAGIGIVAAAQSEKVQSAWLGTWNQVKAGAIESAAAIEPVLVRVAGNVGAAFERMQPQLTAAFSAAAPQIEVFARGITDLAENALPGMVRAVEQGMPVTRGLADFLAKVGTGLSDFFDRISAHGPAAGSVFSSLGDIMGDLLPILGELLGQGAELASVALPLLAHGMGLVLDVVSALGPALPALVAGFAAFKVVQQVGGWMAGFSGNLAKYAQDLAFASYGNSAFAGSAGKMSTVVSGAGSVLGGLGRALPVIGIAFGVLSAAAAANEQKINSWAHAMLEGGAAATHAQQQMGNPSFWDKFTYNLTHWGNTTKVATAQQRDAAKAADELLASMTPLGQAQVGVTQATSRLEEVTGLLGPTSRQTGEASEELEAAQAELERQQAALELATEGVTQAMIDQANQAMGSINADFAYQDALDGLEDKQRTLADAIRDHGAASEEASDAQRAYAEGIWDTAQKAAAASPILDGLKEGTAEYDRAVQNLTLQSLVDMRAGLGPEMQAAVDVMIATLQAGGASLDEIGAKTPTPVVDANIDPLTGKVVNANAQIDGLDARRPLPGLDLATGPFDGKTQTSFNLLDVLGAQQPTPTANLNPVPLNGVVASVQNSLAILNGQRPSPVATLYAQTGAAENALNYAARNRTSTIFASVVATGTAKIGGAVGGIVHKYAEGGFEPMRGGIAQVVKPNTWRVIGDRITDDEAYIPINRAQRSREILAQTAERMGFGLQPMAGGGSLDRSGGRTAGGVTIHGGVTLQIPGAFNLGSGIERKRFIAEVRDGLLNLERSER